MAREKKVNYEKNYRVLKTITVKLIKDVKKVIPLIKNTDTKRRMIANVIEAEKVFANKLSNDNEQIDESDID